MRRQRRRKQSDTAAIRYGLASCGREPMNSATDIVLSDICRFCISLGIVSPLEKFADKLFQIHHCCVLYQNLRRLRAVTHETRLDRCYPELQQRTNMAFTTVPWGLSPTISTPLAFEPMSCAPQECFHRKLTFPRKGNISLR